MQTAAKRPTGESTRAKEHAVLRGLMAELQAICSEPRSTGMVEWVGRLCDRFAHFEAHYVKHIALEEQAGYLAPVMDEARPTLNKEVARLRAEHPQFVTIMASIRAEMKKLTPSDTLVVRDLCGRITRLLCFIEQHEQEEDLLLIDGVYRDIGVKD